MSFRETFKSKYSSEEILKALKEKDSKNKYVDNRFWKPTIDPKTGQGGALIRFLPSKYNKTPFVRVYEHAFQGPTGMWYIEKSLTTLGLPDPVSEYNSKEWMTGIESKQNEVRKRKRKVSYISNIYVIKDPANPNNDGKVFLFKYGKKIYDKMMKMLEPPKDDIEDTPSIDPFDLFEGCNFVLRIKRGEGGFPNYDDSKFESKKTQLLTNDVDLENVYNMTYDLDEFLKPETFKSYDELKERFNMVMGSTVTSETEKETVSKPASKTVSKPVAVDEAEEEDDVDELLAKIKKLKVNVDEDDDVPF